MALTVWKWVGKGTELSFDSVSFFFQKNVGLLCRNQKFKTTNRSVFVEISFLNRILTKWIFSCLEIIIMVHHGCLLQCRNKVILVVEDASNMKLVWFIYVFLSGKVIACCMSVSYNTDALTISVRFIAPTALASFNKSIISVMELILCCAEKFFITGHTWWSENFWLPLAT